MYFVVNKSIMQIYHAVVHILVSVKLVTTGQFLYFSSAYNYIGRVISRLLFTAEFTVHSVLFWFHGRNLNSAEFPLACRF